MVGVTAELLLVSAVESVRKLCGYGDTPGAYITLTCKVVDTYKDGPNLFPGTLQTTSHPQKRGPHVYFLYRNTKAYFCRHDV